MMPAFAKDWWMNTANINCSLGQLRNALQYAFFVDTYPWDPNATAKSISGRVQYPWLPEALLCYCSFRIEQVSMHHITILVVVLLMWAICMLRLRTTQFGRSG